MATPAIRVEGVGKRYDLGKLHLRENRLSELVQQALAAPVRALRPGRDPSKLRDAKKGGELWALRDVSLEISRGEIVGLIGPNGAGKSTLLKLISAITPPDRGPNHGLGPYGDAARGRHRLPSRADRARERLPQRRDPRDCAATRSSARFDEIVDFSGVGQFIDTPVKRYSSGMFVRLAFAVAAHLDPEILIVDEVLAVGDAEFQRKCLGKLHEASELGRTVVFVSHNLESVQRLCDRAYLIDKGGVVAEGTPAHAINEYMSSSGPVQGGGVAVIAEDAERDVGTGDAKLTQLAMRDRGGAGISSVHLGERFCVALQIDARRRLEDVAIELGISTPDRQRVATVTNIDRPGERIALAPGLNEVEVEVEVSLLPGDYILDLGIYHGPGEMTDYVYCAYSFEALNSPVEGQEAWPWPNVRGYVRPNATWREARQVSEPAVPASDEPGRIRS